MIFSEIRFTLFRIMLWRRKSGCAAAANSRAPMPWGRLRGAAPGYPAAAARPPQSASNHDQTLTDLRPSDGLLGAFWGTCFSLAKCCARASFETGLAGTRPAKLMSKARRDQDILRRPPRAASGFREIQLHADAVGIVEEEL